MTQNSSEGLVTPDFTFDYADFYGDYFDRSQEQAQIYYETLGVAREDKAKRDEVYLRNFKFFGAPHVAFLFMPSFGDNIRVAACMGRHFFYHLSPEVTLVYPKLCLAFMLTQ
ncbi:nitroreductase [Xenorhabdus mauleonii]|uniref:Nitroreductase n=2 Tax=Xenorhabdus mauleonii TaxID=351675 RepID=A0A1I3SCT5_9GAMM|nr:nitroreductase [Xenorhabdus mauleonii]SFJ56633.1 hypothetical protein SAMN05421680_11168 [Xenorhabdus mauleonii]